MTDSLKRSRKLRSGHRMSAKKTVNSIMECIEDSELPITREGRLKLQHLRLTLSDKIDTIRDLDQKILSLIKDDDIENEIADTDNFNSSLTGALVELDSKLVFEPHPSTPLSTNGDDHSTHDSVRSTTSSAVKLPKLELVKFTGHLTEWQHFWDTFNSSIHERVDLSNVEKFNYLKASLRDEAAIAITGLAVTSANYDAAITLLKRRYGNKQLIINAHMEQLLSLDPVTSQDNLRGLRQMFDITESHVRALQALGVPSDSYGVLLTSVFMSKLPKGLQLIISRNIKDGDTWTIDNLMKTFREELEARERTSQPTTSKIEKERYPKSRATATALLAPNSQSPTCTYCKKDHPSAHCTTVTDIEHRKQILMKGGRCYVCLRRGHLARDCPSKYQCNKCKGRHNLSICTGQKYYTRNHGDNQTEVKQYENSSKPDSEGHGRNNGVTLHTVAGGNILLQTAKAIIYNPSDPRYSTEARLILDSGSQRSYVTHNLMKELNLSSQERKNVTIKTFGSSSSTTQSVDTVKFAIRVNNGPDINMSALGVPMICEPLVKQRVVNAVKKNEHLQVLYFADYTNGKDDCQVDILIGTDQYWDIVTGQILRGQHGPTAIETKLGWVLSGPTYEHCEEDDLSNNLVVTHVLRCESEPVNHIENLENTLRSFWELESIGIKPISVHDSFLQTITFRDDHYEVSLPWKTQHRVLPDNYQISLNRLHTTLRKLRKDPAIFAQYDAVIRDQLSRGIVSLVTEPYHGDVGKVHYMPHQGVIRQSRLSSKLRVVYDASAKREGPSLNDCLHIGPALTQSLVDILLRFRIHKVAFTGDIEKAFLMVHVAECDRDVLRFLWIDDLVSDIPKIITLRFNRVVFGVSSSPFLLNATIKHHMQKYMQVDAPFVETFSRSIYVDDVILGADDDEEACKFYMKAKLRLQEGGFTLRKFVTNSSSLRMKIDPALPDDENQPAKLESHLREDDSTYVDSTLGSTEIDESSEHKILGIRWDYDKDNLIFDYHDIIQLADDIIPTKRKVISIAGRIYDPLGLMAVITIRFKLLFQELCKTAEDWDEPLVGPHLVKWCKLIDDLKKMKPIYIPRRYLSTALGEVYYELHGFCDASQRAYAAVIYLKIVGVNATDVKLISCKTRVAPLAEQTIPRLELLSALILARLMDSVRKALETEIAIKTITCWSDSKVALFWIRNEEKEWKLFVQNRAMEIRSLIPPIAWQHCPGKENPADIPSRGLTSVSELNDNTLWWCGPPWLSTHEIQQCEDDSTVPDECFTEMKKQKNLDQETSVLMAENTESDPVGIGNIIDCTKYSTLKRLMRVTVLVLKFIDIVRTKNQLPDDVESTLLKKAENLWIHDVQNALKTRNKFQEWHRQLTLFTDAENILRCEGRIQNSELPFDTKHPILLDAQHPVTTLIVENCHKRTMHGGVKTTLSELRARYWIIRGRQLVKKLIHKCVTCKRYGGRPFKPPPAPPLPEFRVTETVPFSYVGLDYAGPMFSLDARKREKKIWICLFTCCVTRAVHLEIVENLTPEAFLRCFRRFTARRSTPSIIVSDNGKSFLPASRELINMMQDQKVKMYFSNAGITWSYNLQRAPWWGGFFERLIKSMKGCLKKTIGKAKLSHDELSTLLVEVECVLNSRPLTYTSTDDVEEPLTPSHLLCGHRIQAFPYYYSNDLDLDTKITALDLNNRMKYLSIVISHYWKRWSREYLLELREAHRYGSKNDTTQENELIKVDDVVLVHDEDNPRGFWRLGRVTELIRGVDDNRVRGASVLVRTKLNRASILKRPIQSLYPMEITSN